MIYSHVIAATIQAEMMARNRADYEQALAHQAHMNEISEAYKQALVTGTGTYTQPKVQTCTGCGAPRFTAHKCAYCGRAD